MILTFVVKAMCDVQAVGLEQGFVDGRAEGAGWALCNCVAPFQFFERGGEEEAASWAKGVGDLAQEEALGIFFEEEEESPGEDAVEGAGEEGGFFSGRAVDGYVREAFAEFVEEGG